MKMSRKQVTFDLDTKALRVYYPKDNWREAYKVIKRHMRRNGFIWLQGSVYVSKTPMRAIDIVYILRDFVKKNPWANLCMRDCRQANLGKEHSANHLFDKNANVPTREGLRNQVQNNLIAEKDFSDSRHTKESVDIQKNEKVSSLDSRIKDANKRKEPPPPDNKNKGVDEKER